MIDEENSVDHKDDNGKCRTGADRESRQRLITIQNKKFLGQTVTRGRGEWDRYERKARNIKMHEHNEDCRGHENDTSLWLEMG